jgi:predicted GH43/DUF377 family glycosyl hydrolase
LTRQTLLLLAVVSCSCGKYADFTLPPPDASGPKGPFHWEAAAEPVLSRGDWDSGDVLNPSVIRFHGEYLNLYSGYDGRTWSTGMAASSDGIHWTKRGRILSPDAGNGSAVVVGDRIFYWYQTGSPVQIALAKSTGWNDAAVVLKTGPRGSWDEAGVADPYVIQRNGEFYLYYLGMDRARRQRLGVARSSDGVRWTKLVGNPILELGGSGAFDEMGLGEPAVWTSGGAYWMLYTGRARGEKRRIGLARSTDGVYWVRESLVIEGTEAWDKEVVCDPTVEVLTDGVRVWFGGGDVARPDQGLHGGIGVGVLR